MWGCEDVANFVSCTPVDYVDICNTGIDFKIKTIELQGKRIKLQIW